MKRIVEDTEVTGMESLMEETVLLLCANYFYTGKLTGVNANCVELTNPSIVYETGEWSAAKWGDVQRLHIDKLYVQVASIESFCKGK